MTYQNKRTKEVVTVMQFDGKDYGKIYSFCLPTPVVRFNLVKGDYVTKTIKGKIDVYSKREFERNFEVNI